MKEEWMGKGVNGKGEGPRGEEGGEISWYVKGIKNILLK